MEGRLENIVILTEGEDDQETPANGSDMGNATGATKVLLEKQSKRTLPQMLNKATGKESTNGATFSHQNWDGQTASYYCSIPNRNLETLGDIVAGALCLLATTNRLRPLESDTNATENAIA